MNGIMDFIANNYIIFIIISLFLIFALIGYFVESKRGEGTPFKIEQEKTPEIKLEDIHVTNNISLKEAVNNTAGVKQDQSNPSQNNI